MQVNNDRLSISEYGLLAMTLATGIALMLILMLGMNAHRDALQATQRCIKTLALTTPAIIPSGRALRSSAYIHPSIDLRHSPHLPQVNFPPKSLMAGRLKPDKGNMSLK